ncbi:chromate transporter [Psychrobacillus insolitus]|uniref:Chromate transporter n=2 Tax=Psychrobacillus insolitus TaxID=1461 RepID=A0A2W7MGP1_9BACI|nr:chromate transporter [Psychrobacillus insolitus]PZX05606.1 chromate transporter [Psychrobacillus insolitus]
MRIQLNIFIAFFRSGMLGFGGGPAVIPLVYKEVVDTYKWMNDQEFSDVLALGNALPGPIITKMAGYIGYRVAGLWGMVTALIATVIPSFILMLILLTSFNQFKDNGKIQGMTNAVIPIVGVMLAVLTWQFMKNAKDGLGWKIGALILIVSFILMEVLNMHPGIVIGLLLAVALLTPRKKKGSKLKDEESAVL